MTKNLQDLRLTLKECRQRKGITIVEAAQKMGMSRHWLYRIERGLRKTLDYREVQTLQRFYEIELGAKFYE